MKTIPVRRIQPDNMAHEVADGFRIRNLSEVLSGKDMKQDHHRHDFYFILIVSNGKGVHEIDFVEYPITNHTVFMMRPGQVHQLQLKAGSEGYLLEINKRFQRACSTTIQALLQKATNGNYCKLDEKSTAALLVILKSMQEEYNSRDDGFAQVIAASFEIFLVRYLRYRKKKQVAPPATTYQQEKLQEFLDLLEVHIHSQKQVAAYANMVSLSPYQLNSITKTLLGKTVAKVIEDQILLEAKRYLLATSNQVTQIAYQLGYEDTSYFIRLFKKLTGHTPEAFRKNFQ